MLGALAAPIDPVRIEVLRRKRRELVSHDLLVRVNLESRAAAASGGPHSPARKAKPTASANSSVWRARMLRLRRHHGCTTHRPPFSPRLTVALAPPDLT